jgi:hypothetical protein
MTLREFIEQEIEAGNVFDVEEFGEKLKSLKWEDGEAIPHEEFEDYLDYNLDSAAVIHDFGTFYYSMRYEIALAYEEGEE